MADDFEPVALEDIAEAQAYAAKEMQHLLGTAAVKQAFDATEKQILAEWKRGQSPLEREMAWHSYQAFLKLKAKLQAFAERPPLHTEN